MSPTFGFLHGSWHTGGCWDPTRQALERRGVPSVTVTMPIDDPTQGAADYAAQIVEQWRGIDDLVVVAHSAGGLTAPLLPALRPVRGIIFLAALLPEVGDSLAGQRAAGHQVMTEQWLTEYLPQQVRLPDGRTEWPAELAREIFYHDVADPALVEAALAELRPQAMTPLTEVTSLQEWPSVPMDYLACADDRVVSAAAGSALARQRLGIEPRRMPGGHSPFLARPEELVDRLLEVAEQQG
ncbi:hypothetical protein CGZ95_08555 [Enemella evansiae]|uniref:alpha/beta fold hydrolase n=1 Tax=Enemella evansiae TaxID=2016499 RepID=UPI000B972FE8|nr:alpha/beta hydrolase [Enemella evansiae]OYO00670.1 hypothetical protein CGZ95_08555 [Enemella evansiae]